MAGVGRRPHPAGDPAQDPRRRHTAGRPHGGAQGTGFEGAAQACSWVWSQTGNFFLDASYEDGEYDGFADPWDDDLIAQGTEEWRQASAVMDSVSRLADWLEDDLPGRFAEMLDFVLERLPDREQEDNEHE